MPANATPTETDDFALLAAVWILSCNDEIPEMSHQGIVSRLGLEDDKHLRVLLKRHTELFRHGIPASRLATRKNDLLNDQHLPGWLKEISDANQRRERIQALTRDDFFRNQFRAEASAPKASIEVLKWGLEHIDRLRKVTQERDEARWRWWQNGLVPALSIIVALATVLSGAWMQQESGAREVALKKYELSYRPRQEAYRDFMQASAEAADRAFAGDRAGVAQAAAKLETAFYSVEPFLDPQSRAQLWTQMGEYVAATSRLATGTPVTRAAPAGRDEVSRRRLDLRNTLQSVLLPE